MNLITSPARCPACHAQFHSNRTMRDHYNAEHVHGVPMTNQQKAVLIRRIAADHPQWPTRLVLHVASKQAQAKERTA